MLRLFIFFSLCYTHIHKWIFPFWEPLKKEKTGDKNMDDFITLTIGKKKNIALIAHDGKKAELIQWCQDHKSILEKHFLCGTGTTARMITDKTGLLLANWISISLVASSNSGCSITCSFSKNSATYLRVEVSPSRHMTGRSDNSR